jgi:hypothetical protein
VSKIDFKKTLPELYGAPRQEFIEVHVPKLQFLMIDGEGDPNTSVAYQDALQALYAVSYKTKFASKRELDKDYVVPPLEGLWWADDMTSFSLESDKNSWKWTMMIMQPEWITPQMMETAIALIAKSKGLHNLGQLRFESLHEGLSLQIMHVGSYDDEAPTLRRLHQELMPERGLEPNGKHHEIYLSDPRRVSPDKLRTILRQPVVPVGEEEL